MDRKAENAASLWCVMLGTFPNSPTAIQGRIVDNGIPTTFAFATEMDFYVGSSNTLGDMSDSVVSFVAVSFLKA